MSTKNLARTVMEGGRMRWSQWSRRQHNAQLRAQERQALGALAVEVDLDGALMPRQRPAWHGFDDKLGPARRWLDRQVGRRWDTVRGELLARFDTRTTAGRHIVFCHLLLWVEDPRDSSRHGFAVDRHGILRRTPRKRVRRRPPEPLPCSERELLAWLGGRRVGARGDVLFWFTQTTTSAFRQQARLGRADAARWRALPAWFRDQQTPEAAPPAPDWRPY
jgi:hypothetical protein